MFCAFFSDAVSKNYTFFFVYINNQKFKTIAPKISNLLNNFKTICRSEQGTKIKTKTIHCENRLKPFFCIVKLREMLTFGLVKSKVCIAYSRCSCNKPWRSSECLNIQTIEFKQLLNNFLGRFFRKA